MHMLVCILHVDITSQTSLKIKKILHLLQFFNKTRASIISLGFQYFELRNTCKGIPNHIIIQVFSNEFLHR